MSANPWPWTWHWSQDGQYPNYHPISPASQVLCIRYAAMETDTVRQLSVMLIHLNERGLRAHPRPFTFRA